jgi:hypothetical protein
MKATIIASTDEPEHVAAAEAFLAKWRDALQFVSENKGCGCCVHIWDVDGPPEILDRIPSEIRAWSDAEQ